MPCQRLVYGDNIIICDICNKHKSKYICASCRSRFYCSIKCRFRDMMQFHQIKCSIIKKNLYRRTTF